MSNLKKDYYKNLIFDIIKSSVTILAFQILILIIFLLYNIS